MNFQNGSSFQFFLSEEGNEAISNLKGIPEWLEIEVQEPAGKINKSAFGWIWKSLFVTWISAVISIISFVLIWGLAWNPLVVSSIISVTIFVFIIIWAAWWEYKKWKAGETTGIVYIRTKDGEGQDHIGKYRWTTIDGIDNQ
jgi:hypothetical protein